MTNLEYITEEGLVKLREKIKYLENIERIKISKQISEARDKGDISENSEYDAAKAAQNILEIKIINMKRKLFNSRIIDKSKLDNNKVSILSTVFLKNLDNGSKYVYTLVPEYEADLNFGKISINSPVSIGLLGKRKGEIVNIKLPNDIYIKLEIIDIKIL
jgi:transcription elongation factor GreA